VTFRQGACGRQNRFKCGEFGPGLQRLATSLEPMIGSRNCADCRTTGDNVGSCLALVPRVRP
jgi:hypothetical protein